jgi:cytochrome c oxidase cbb3-type subunit 4
MNMGLIHSVWTVLLVILFLGIVFWAFSGRRRQSFDAAARLPLDDDVPGRADVAPDRMSRATGQPGGVSGDRHHG